MEKGELKIVIVEDDINFGQGLQEVIRGKGFQCQWFRKPEDALSSAKLHFANAYVIDCLLPRVSGIDLALQLRQLAGDQFTLILMSGIFRDKAFIKENTSRTGATAFLEKPFQAQDLIAKLEGALDHLIDEVFDPFTSAITSPDLSAGQRLQIIESTTSIHGYEFPRLLSLLLDRSISGTLKLTDPKQQVAEITISTGIVSKVHLPTPSSLFGALLLERQLLTATELQPFLQKNSADPRPIGERLVAASLISPHVIETANRDQMKIRLSELVSDSRYDVQFQPQRIVEAHVALDSDALVEIMCDSVQSKIDPSWLRTFYLPWMNSPVRRSAKFTDKHACFSFAPLSHTPGLHRTLTEADSISGALASSGLSEELFFICLHTLVMFGLIRLEQSAKAIIGEDQAPRLQKLVNELASKTHYQTLGLSSTAKASEVKKAYLELAKVFHPDKVAATASKEVKDLMQKLFSKMTAAYEVLKDEEHRKRYDKELEQGKAESILAAEGLIEDGRALLKNAHFSKAHEKFEKAKTLIPMTTELKLLTLWSVLAGWSKSSDPTQLPGIYQEINKVPPEDRHSGVYHFVKGLLHKHTSEFDIAKKCFKQALFLIPDFREAQRELNVIDISDKSKSVDLLHGDLKDVVGLLFKKKK
ncbi:MAG: hypothetical protein COT74_01285 [Bdellovibrionales bacterium CG10_big_fil_rev_8_21_14_0_10_45_34]|nr:MAG: hypothetical protein COT74_01285 [Bdellovibrionales bacterium CG10_big_fil_rev_8_21_14_0_10_45_34]